MFEVYKLVFRDPLKPQMGCEKIKAGSAIDYKAAQFIQFNIILDSANDPRIKTAIIEEVLYEG